MLGLGLGPSCCPGSSMAGPGPSRFHLWLSLRPAASMFAVLAYISVLSGGQPNFVVLLGVPLTCWIELPLKRELDFGLF